MWGFFLGTEKGEGREEAGTKGGRVVFYIYIYF